MSRSSPPRRLPLARFALRDLKAGLAGLRIFLLCIALGVAAIVGVASLAQSLADGLGREGRVVLGGDASFTLIHRRLAPAEQAFLAGRGSLSTVASMRAMARRDGGEAALVEVKAVDESWPRLGAAVLSPAMAVADALAARDGVFGAAVEDALLARLKLAVGDRIEIGEAQFVIRATIVSEPDRLAGGIGIGPQVLISQAALDATRLVQPGSLVRWTTRVLMGGPGGVPTDTAVKTFLDEAKANFPEAGWEVRSRLNVAPDFARNLDRFAEFLALVGLISLIVGGVGVANAAEGFVERKRQTLAILKAIGATGSDVVLLALVEFLVVAAAGSLIGAALGAATPFIVDALFGSLSPIPLAPSIDPRAIGLGLLYGLLTAMVFALAPLGRAHDLPVSNLFRAMVEDRPALPRARYLVATALATLALAAAVIAASPQRTLALTTIGATFFAFLALRLVAAALIWLARRAPSARRVEWRMAIAAIHRPGALTPSVVLSLGLGLAALVALSLIDSNLRGQLHQTEPGVTPNFFFLDIRSAELPAFRAFLAREAKGAKIEETPMMRGRFVRIAGVPVESAKASESSAWALESDRGVTFSSIPPEGSEVVAGSWWPADYSGPPLVSMEEEVARGLGLKLDDEVVVNVLGRNIAARVANLRKVNWRSFTINFVLVYSPNTFKGAPYSELVAAALPAGATPDKEVAVLNDAARDFPGVVGLRVSEALAAVDGLVAKLALAIRSATAVALLTSALVLAGALAANRQARMADAVILKILGATRARLLVMFLIEYALLGAATAAFGVAAGTFAAYQIVAHVMNFDFAFDALPALAAAAGGLALTVALGMIGAFRILGRKPAAYLREL